MPRPLKERLQICICRRRKNETVFFCVSLILITLISCKPQLNKTGTRIVHNQDFIQLGDELYDLAFQCWDRGPGALEIEQIVNRVVTSNNYIISVHAFGNDIYLPAPSFAQVKGKGIRDPYFKVTLTKFENDTIVLTEERGVAYGRKEYFSSEVRNWLNGQKRCSRRR